MEINLENRVYLTISFSALGMGNATERVNKATINDVQEAASSI